MAHFVLVPGMWLDARSWCQVTLPSSSWPQHPLADASQRSGNHTAGLGRRRCAKLETRMELNRASELRSSLRNSSCSAAGIEHDGLNVLGKAQPPMDMRFDIIVQYLPPNRRLSHFQRSPPGYAVSPPLLVPVSNSERYRPSRTIDSMTNPPLIRQIRMEMQGQTHGCSMGNAIPANIRALLTFHVLIAF